MEERKNVIGMIVFMIFLAIIIFGGYIAMKYFVDEDKKIIDVDSSKQDIDLRIDTSKDYIYFENGKEILESEEIYQEDVVLNFTTLTNINETLKKENEEIYKSIKYSGESIYSLNYREYENYKFGDYVSLIVKDFYYDVDSETKPTGLKGYVVNLKNGKLISEDELLQTFNMNLDTIKTKVRERLNNTQILEENVIDIEGTINNFNQYTLYVNKNGKLAITFVVKSNQFNYNDSIELN